MEAIGEDGALARDQQRPIGDVESGYSYFRDGDVVVAKITPCFENGKGAVMVDLHGGIGFGTTELIVVRPAPRKLDGKYLHWVFTSSGFRKSGEAEMFGAGGQKRVSEDFVRNFAHCWPQVSEQQRIAAFLDRETAKIDTLIQKQERLIELLAEKRQAVITHAVTKGIATTAPMKDSGFGCLGEVPKHWAVSCLKHVWTVTDCKHLTAEFVDEGIPLASIREAQCWTVDLTSARKTTARVYGQLVEGGRRPRPGDIIFTRNATVGQTAKVTDAHPLFAMGQDVCLLRKRCEHDSTDYLLYVMRSAVIQRQLADVTIGATFMRVNVDDICSLIVPTPPTAEQHVISQFLAAQTNKLDSLIARSNQSIELMKERRSALISAAVTGKIDVREAT
jgi:type I restriction enzyme S subunit